MAEDVLPVDLFPLEVVELRRRPRRLFKHARVVSRNAKTRLEVKQPFTFMARLFGQPGFGIGVIHLLSGQWMTPQPYSVFPH
jgi:hypothetical protein